jgi:hypothetical protein
MGSASPTSARRLYILDTGLSDYETPQKLRGRILSCSPDGTALHTVIDNLKTLPDGITIDHEHGHMYWTNMGPSFKEDNGSIERANLDGSDRRTIVPAGTLGVFTPKQITLARRSRKLYWCDREGMKVMRCGLDGSDVEVLVSTGTAEQDKEGRRRPGIAVDEESGYFYWTQKGPSKGRQGRIFRAEIANPEKVELLLDGLPEPIDLELEGDMLYWTDRGDPPRGNSLNRIRVRPSIAKEQGPEILAKRLHETIGLTIDPEAQVAYVTDLSGGVYAVGLQTKAKTVLFAELGDITGIALA